MAKSDTQKKAGVMAKEWWKSRSNEQTIEDLVAMGVLHNKELVGWHAPEGEGYPDPQLGEIMVFEDFFKWGFWGSSTSFPSGSLSVLQDWDLQSASQLDSPCLHLHSSLRSIWRLPAPFRLLSPSFLSMEERKRWFEDSRGCIPQPP